MISIYTASVLTTAMVAGLTFYTIDASRIGPAHAQIVPAVERAHAYGIHRARTQFPPQVNSTGIHEVNLGPYAQTGATRSFVRTNYDPLTAGGDELWKTYHVTWVQSRDAEQSARIADAISIPETDGQETWTTVYVSRGESLRRVPDIDQQIPENAVVIVTEVAGGQP